MKKVLTLCIVYNDTHVLLGMKKRGFGEGRWNGFGGKVEKGESIKNAAKRELREEAGIVPTDMQKRGVLNFEFEGNPEKLEVHVFSASSFNGEPKESDEMRPEWFDKNNIPYENMWPDDKYWLPILFNGKNFQGNFYFKNNAILKKYTLKKI